MATDKIPTMLRLPPELHAKIRKLASIEHRSMNMQIEYAISEYIYNYEQINGSIQSSTPSLKEE